MSNEKFKVKFGLAVGDTAATIDGTTGEARFAEGEDGQVIVGAGVGDNGKVEIGNPTRTSAGNPYLDYRSSVGTLDYDVRLIASGGGGTDGQGKLDIIAGEIEHTGNFIVNGNLQVDGNTTLGSNSSDTVTVNGLVTNNITFSFNDTATPRGILGQTSTGAQDFWFVGGAEEGGVSNAGYAMIATGDDGTEPIYARQYTGSPLSGTVSKQLTLLDASGNTTIPGDLFVEGNEIFSSGGNRNLTFSGTNVIVEGDLTVGGNDIKTSDGTTALTLTNTSGDVAVAGDLTVTGGDITTPVGTANVFNTPTTVNIGAAATTVSIGANTGTTTINNSLVADDISILTVDATNIEVTNIKAKDGTAAMTIADTTGAVNVSTSLTVDNINIAGNTISSTDTNGNINLTPNGTGDTLVNFVNGGNFYNNRNYVLGAIRNATTESIGDIWAVNSTGPVNPYRGVSLDNSQDTAKGPATVLRSFSGGAVNGSGTRGRVVFEKARGTAASPTAVQGGDVLGSVDMSGYTSTGWVNDIAGVVPAFYGFTASENWVSNTNLGSQFILSVAPTATTITSSANLVNCIQMNPQVSNFRSDAFAIGRGKTSAFTATGCSVTGTTLTIGTVTSGAVGVGQLIQSSVNTFSPGIYIVSGSGSTWTLSSSAATSSGLTVTGVAGYIGGWGGTNVDALADLRLLTNVIKNSASTTVITTGTTNVAFALPVKFPVYTAAALAAITGAVGWQASVSNSPTVGGRMAFWDTTNSRWSYISDNSAV